METLPFASIPSRSLFTFLTPLCNRKYPSHSKGLIPLLTNWRSLIVTSRDDFPNGVKSILALRAGYRCSKPDCRALTVGPSDADPAAFANIGVAAHITAASPGGPRFDPTLTPEERRSVTNGIWTCQNHGKEIDDDVVRYSFDLLRAWKHHAEVEARAMLGHPISAQSLDISMQVAVHRALNNSLLITGTTNLPTGTKLWTELYDHRTDLLLGQVETLVINGMLAASGFMQGAHPYPHGWYIVQVVAYFNGPWQQPEAVIRIVGREGEYLVGRFAEPLHPEFDESEKRLRASFAIIAPPLTGAPPPTSADLQTAIEIVKRAVLIVNGRKSASSVCEVVDLFMASPGLRVLQGWSAEAEANGSIVVTFSFWNNKTPEKAAWVVILETSEVRYKNLYGKYMSWVQDY
jgi:hypothetical protein